MDEIIKGLKEFFSQATADFALKIIGAVAMLFLGFFLIKRAMRLFEKSTGKSKLDKSLISFLSSLLSILLKTILVIIIATYLGVPQTSFIAILSSAGLAIGLALQGSLGNFAGGLMLLLFKPFHVGDYIKTSVCDGTVVSMNIMYTQLDTPDRKRVMVPNSVLSNNVLTNFSYNPTRRIDIPLTVESQADVEVVKALMLKVANDHPLVLKDPEPTARMGAFDGALPIYTLRCFGNTADFWTITFDLFEGMKTAFEQAGIDLPPPLQAVTLERKAE